MPDVYDALISKRVYREATPHDDAVGIIADGRGRHFDPDLADAFLRSADCFEAIALRFQE